MKRFLILGILIILAAVIVWQGIEVRDPDKVRLAVYNGFTDIPVLLAQEKGYFLKNRIELEMIPVKTGGESVALLENGQIDIGNVSSWVFAQEVLTGQELQLLSVYGFTWEGFYLLVKKDSGIKTPYDLKGRTVAVNMGVQEEFYIYRVMDYYKILPSEIRLENMTDIEFLEKYPSKVDAVITAEPYLSRIMKRHGESLLNIPLDKVYRINMNFIVHRNDHLPEDVYIRFLKAVNRGCEDLMAQKGSEIYHPVSEFSDGAIKSILGQVSFSLKQDQLILLTIEQQLKWLQRGGSHKDIPDLMSLFYSDPLEKAVPGAVTLIFVPK